MTLAVLVAAAFAAAADPVTWTARLSPVSEGKGQVVTVHADIKDGWHLYSMQSQPQPGPASTTIAAEAPLEVAGPFQEQEPVKKLDPNFGVDVTFFAKRADFTAALTKGADSGKIKIRFQACNDRTCLPPKTVEVSLDGAPAIGVSAIKGETQPMPADQYSASVERAKSSGILPFLGLSFIAGLLSLLTPCVFPMVPITVSYFTKRQESGGKGLSSVFAYVGGIIASFAGFGVVVSALFGAGGIQRFATNPYINLILAAVFIGLALTLFGIFTPSLPSGLVNKLSSGSRKQGLIGPAMMGMTFTLTSFTCTVPFMGTILAGASQGSYLYPVLGMLAYGSAFASPFFILAMFPQLLAKLPKSGSWLETTKAFMGFVELAAAVKFISNADLVLGTNLISRPVFLVVWAIIAIAAALFLLGIVRLPKVELPAKKGAIRLGMAAATMGAGIWMATAAPGRALGEMEAFLPPGATGWSTDLRKAQQLARQTNKPLLVSFTGVTCTNCRWMEKNMFLQPEVVTEFKKFVLVELYTDRERPEDLANRKTEERLTGVDTLPAYVTLTPDGTKIGVFQGSTRDRSEFLSFLRRKA
jgi:thiol:disulfide interchange protein DsbD